MLVNGNMVFDNLISLSLIVVPSWFDVKCSIPRDNTYRSYCSKFKPSFVPYFGKDNLRTFPIHFYIIVKILHLTSNSSLKQRLLFFLLFIVLCFDFTILEKYIRANQIYINSSILEMK